MKDTCTKCLFYVMQIINTRKIFEKIINQNIAKNIYKEYNIVNQKIFAIINLRKSIKNGGKL